MHTDDEGTIFLFESLTGEVGLHLTAGYVPPQKRSADTSGGKLP